MHPNLKLSYCAIQLILKIGRINRFMWLQPTNILCMMLSNGGEQLMALQSDEVPCTSKLP